MGLLDAFFKNDDAQNKEEVKEEKKEEEKKEEKCDPFFGKDFII